MAIIVPIPDKTNGQQFTAPETNLITDGVNTAWTAAKTPTTLLDEAYFEVSGSKVEAGRAKPLVTLRDEVIGNKETRATILSKVGTLPDNILPEVTAQTLLAFFDTTKFGIVNGKISKIA